MGSSQLDQCVNAATMMTATTPSADSRVNRSTRGPEPRGGPNRKTDLAG